MRSTALIVKMRPDRLDTIRGAEHEATPIPLRDLQALPASECADELAGLVEDQLAAIGLKSKDEEERPAVLAGSGLWEGPDRLTRPAAPRS